MTYKEFKIWCYDRSCDGCRSMETALCCIEIMNTINRLHFWKRKKEWMKIKDEIETNVVSVINAKIRDMKRNWVRSDGKTY